MGEEEGVCNTSLGRHVHRMAVYICLDKALMVLLNRIAINYIYFVFSVYLLFMGYLWVIYLLFKIFSSNLI